jgi:broad specificity phosphatase PhoE
MRHGPTFYQGRLKRYLYPVITQSKQVTITKTGEKIVRQTARQLPCFDIIFCSDAKRTYQTAKIVQEITKSGPIIKDELLRDTHLGIYHGGLRKDFHEWLKNNNLLFQRPLEGESFLDVWKRLQKFVKKIDSSKNILIVSHGTPLWLIQGILNKWTIQKTCQKKKQLTLQTAETRLLK